MYNTIWKDTAFKKTTKKPIENDLEKREGASFPLPNGTKVLCGNCGQCNPRDNNFCTQCGKPLAL